MLFTILHTFSNFALSFFLGMKLQIVFKEVPQLQQSLTYLVHPFLPILPCGHWIIIMIQSQKDIRKSHIIGEKMLSTHCYCSSSKQFFVIRKNICSIWAMHRSLLPVSAILDTLASSQAKLTGTQLASLTLLSGYFLYFYWQLIPWELSCTRMKMSVIFSA